MGINRHKEVSGSGDRGSGKRFASRKTPLVVILIAASLALSVSSATGDLLAQGTMTMSFTTHGPSIIVNQTNVTYKATTFVWNTVLVNNTTIGTLRVHVNFDQNNTSEFFNILSIVNVGNTTGNITVNITKSARIGSYVLNETYTSTISVYISHEWQTQANPGIELLNGTASPPLQLYPSDQISYYIGVIYTIPPDLPAEIQQNLNSLGQYITFTIALSDA